MGSLITEHPSPTRAPRDGQPRQVDTDRDSLDERVTDLVVESGSGFELFAGLIAAALDVQRSQRLVEVERTPAG